MSWFLKVRLFLWPNLLPGRKKERKVKSFSHVRILVTPWTVACQAPPSMRFSRLEYWRGLPFPPPGDRPNPGFEPGSPALQADSSPSAPPGKPLPGRGHVHSEQMNTQSYISCHGFKSAGFKSVLFSVTPNPSLLPHTFLGPTDPSWSLG